MNPSEAKEMGEYLKRCFPMVSDEKRDTIAKCFEACETDATFEAIRLHVERYELVNAPELLRDAKRFANEAPESRVAASIAAANQKREAVMSEKRKADKDVERMFDRVKRMPESERERHRAAILAVAEKVNPFLAGRVRTADPTKSPTLAALICQRLEK